MVHSWLYHRIQRCRLSGKGGLVGEFVLEMWVFSEVEIWKVGSFVLNSASSWLVQFTLFFFAERSACHKRSRLRHHLPVSMEDEILGWSFSSKKNSGGLDQPVACWIHENTPHFSDFIHWKPHISRTKPPTKPPSPLSRQGRIRW